MTQIHLAAHQPRRYFSTQGMESLVASIREHGILQPLLVRPLESGNYELIAGERRYRAAQTFGMEQVPVIIRHLNDQDAFQVALLENLQREDLNPVEETEAILQLLSIRLQCSQGEVISLLNHIANRQKQKTETTNNVVRNQWEMVEKIFSVRVTPRANASKLYLLTTEVKNQRKISISRLIYFHRFKAIA
ncbi:ParB/RepB/Spo0J family partition protein [Nostoc flagelliforme]|nr:ParB/RepB/Spo0J family partition protein [Nostoc flagelliforme]